MTNIKRDVCYCSFSLFVLADRALLPTDADTPSLLTMTTEPVEVFDYRERDEFLAAVQRTIARGNPKIQMPPEQELYWDENGMPGLKTPVELKYAGVKTWNDLERNSVFYTVECYERGFVVISCGRKKNGLWSDDKVLELRMPPDVRIEGVVDAILEHLKTRTDLPGFTFGQSQQQTAKGA